MQTRLFRIETIGGEKNILNKEKENGLLVKVSFSTKNFSAGVHASLRRVWCGQFVVFILRKLIETKYESGPKVIRVNDDYAMFDGNHLMSLHFCFLFFFFNFERCPLSALHIELNQKQINRIAYRHHFSCIWPQIYFLFVRIDYSKLTVGVMMHDC